MAIIETINDDWHFWNWLQDSGSYRDNFSLEGAKAVQAWFDEYSDETGENVEFDPIAWCVEFTEYDSLDDFNNQYFGAEYKKGSEYTLETLRDNTTVIELDNGHIVVSDF